MLICAILESLSISHSLISTRSLISIGYRMNASAIEDLHFK